MSYVNQVITLFVLAVPVGCISWTFTHEEIFHEVHEYFVKKSKNSRSLLSRKFFYLFTCEYCFSHYVSIAFLFITRFRLLFNDWTGYLIAGFSIVWVANIYMSLYAFLRQAIKKEKTEIVVLENETKKDEEENKNPGP